MKNKIKENNKSSIKSKMKINKKILKNSNIVKLITILLLLVFAYFFGIFVLKEYIYPDKHINIIQEEAKKNNIDPYLVLAIIKTESGFNDKALSNKQAKGLMQIMDSTANEINTEYETLDTYNIKVNIALGTKYLSYLINKYDGNYYLAICAYNAGIGNVDEWLSEGVLNQNLNSSSNNNIPFKETKNYLKKVISSYEMYKTLYK